MITIGGEGLVKIWDLRMYKEISSKQVPSNIKTCDIS